MRSTARAVTMMIVMVDVDHARVQARKRKERERENCPSRMRQEFPLGFPGYSHDIEILDTVLSRT